MSDLYCDGAKTSWRGRVWKGVRQLVRAQFPGQRLTVPYLIGDTTNDLVAANRHGFDRDELIGIDLSDENVRRARSAGGIAIQGNAHYLLRQWPPTWPIHAMMLDTTSMATSEWVISILTCQGLCRGTTLMANFQRVRKERIRLAEVTEIACLVGEYRIANGQIDMKWSNRARGVSRSQTIHEHRALLFWHQLLSLPKAIDYCPEDIGTYCDKRGRYMDWIVFEYPARRHLWQWAGYAGGKTVARKLAAAKAVQSKMRAEQ